MEIIFLNSDFEDIYRLDSFKSLIWTDRFWKAGDLDLSCAPTTKILDQLALTSYFRIDESPHNMVKETINIKSDIDDGDLLVVQGRSLSSIMDRRLVWDPIVLSGNFQTEVLGMIYDNILNPTDTDRAIADWVNETNSDTLFSSLAVESQFDGKYSVYKALCEVCEAKGVGFRVFYDRDTSQFKFKLLVGVDRSYSQTAVATVAFTSELNNLINAEYVESSVPEKNVCLVAGEEGVGNVRTYVEVGSGTGLSRREVYIEPNISRNLPGGEEMIEADYLLALEGKGEEELAKRKALEAFDGEVDTTMYDYGDEFLMGDILQIADKYGHETKSRVIEMVYSQNKDGIKKYPTFETVE